MATVVHTGSVCYYVLSRKVSHHMSRWTTLVLLTECTCKLAYGYLQLHAMQVVRHVFNWAYGDGQLLHHFPHLAYRRPPNAVELSCIVLLWHACQNPMNM